MSTLTFPPVARPVVSIVMVTYGGWSWVRKALESIIENTEPCYEVIVVDNASPDGLGDVLEEAVGGARIVRNAVNRGFGCATNQGAAYATGEVLAFVNSDAFVHPGWLPPLLERLEDRTVGAVAPRLDNPDGSLQEAGSLVFRNGYTSFYGHGEDAHGAEYGFPRAVDYASAACLLVRRQDFFDTGGFDAAYAPAYFEDVDLCLSLSRLGRKTVYEPRSSVTHLKGASGDPKTATAHWSRNLEIFRSRWAGWLDSRPAYRADSARAAIASRDSGAATRLLIATDRPGVGSSAPARESWLVGELADCYPDARLTFLCTDRTRKTASEGLAERGVEIAAPPDPAAWLARRPFHYDVVVLCGSFARGSLRETFAETQPQAFRVVDVGSRDGAGGGRRSDRTVRNASADAENGLGTQTLLDADLVLVSGTGDLAAVRALSDAVRCVLLPGPFEARVSVPTFEQRGGFLFVASSLIPDDPPDRDALDALIERVLPLVRAERPEIDVTAVVRTSAKRAAALAREGIHVVSDRAEARRHLETAKVVISSYFRRPVSCEFLRDAASAGVPFVATPKAAEALPFITLPAAARAIDERDLARKALALDREPLRWARLRNSLRRAFREACDPDSGRDALTRAFALVGLLPGRNRPAAPPLVAHGA